MKKKRLRGKWNVWQNGLWGCVTNFVILFIHSISCYVVSSKCVVFIFLSLDVTSTIHLFIPAPLMSQYIFSSRCKHDGVRVEMLLWWNRCQFLNKFNINFDHLQFHGIPLHVRDILPTYFNQTDVITAIVGEELSSTQSDRLRWQTMNVYGNYLIFKSHLHRFRNNNHTAAQHSPHIAESHCLEKLHHSRNIDTRLFFEVINCDS